jgi:carboxypeptidase C (cathepsin A)
MSSMRLLRLSVVLLLGAGMAPVSQGAEPPVPAAAAAPAVLAAPARYAVARSGTFNGRRVSYEAVAEETVLRDAAGNPAARLFTFSYVEHARKPDASRPVLFVFNGGPGSASVWTHFGMLGPRQVKFADAVHPPTAPPYTITENPLSLLDVADLVFIDTVGTGYSRLLPGGRAEDYYGVTQDARSVAEFIQDWVTRNERWNSPKFLLGESYGTIRATVLAGTLMGGVMPPLGQLRAMALNGIMILGPAFDVGGSEGNDRVYLTDLPSMVATAWYHGRIPQQGRTLDSVLAEAREFARNEYLQALYDGARLDSASRHQIAGHLAALSGLSADTWLQNDLRIGLRKFQGLLLAAQGRQLGAYDSRYTLATAGAGNDPVVDDPAMGQYTPAFVAAFNQYLTDELGVRSTERYIPIAWTDVNFRWNYGAGPGIQQPHNYANDLATAMRRNPELRVFIGAGYFDLVTTLGGAEYAMTHAAVPQDRVTVRGYPSGHMPYLGDDSARQLGADLRAFMQSAVRQPGDAR